MESSCAKCSSTIAATDQFCIYCGTAVERSNTASKTDNAPSPPAAAAAAAPSKSTAAPSKSTSPPAQAAKQPTATPVKQPTATPVKQSSSNAVKQPPPSAPTATPTPAPAPSPPKSAPAAAQRKTSKSNHDERRDSIDGFGPDDASLAQIADLQKLWVPNDFSDDCMDCGKTFGFPQPRRHHCRVCGKLFCRDCVANKCTIPSSFGYGDKPQRCCKSCTISLQMKAINTPADVFSQRQQAQSRVVSTSTPKANASAPASAPAAAASVPTARAGLRGAATAVVATNRIKSGAETASGVNLNDFASKNPAQVARAEQKECQVCFRQFAIGRRAYHCQRCTRSVCNQCSQGNKPIPELGYPTPVRHCNNCMSKPPQFASLEAEGVVEPLPGFEFLSKMDFKVAVADVGGDNGEVYKVDVYFEPNAAHVKNLNETLRPSDIEAAKEYAMSRKRSAADFDWLVNALGEQVTSKALPNYPDKRIPRGGKKGQSLQVFLTGCLVHPLYRSCDALKAFFGLTNEQFRAFKNAGANTELKVAPEYTDILMWLLLKMEQDQMEHKLATLVQRRKDNEGRVAKQQARIQAYEGRKVNQSSRRMNAQMRYEALVARKESQLARHAREQERLRIQQESVAIVYDDTKEDEEVRATEEDVRQKEKVEFVKSKDAFQTDTTDWNKDMALWSRQRADWSDVHNPPVSKQIANEWLIKAFGITHRFTADGNVAVIPKELINLHTKVQQLQEEEPAILEKEGQALDDEWSELSKERDNWAQDRANMKREDEMCADEDVRYKTEHEHVRLYLECRQKKMEAIEADLAALDMEIKGRTKAYTQRKLRHEALDKEYELEWKKSQDARMAFTSERLTSHNDRIGRGTKRCESLGDQLQRQQKSSRLLLFKRAAMNEERDADTTLFIDHKDGCKSALEAAKSNLAMAPEYVTRLNSDVEINKQETDDIVSSNYRTPMEGDAVDERDPFMNEVRARRRAFQVELDTQLKQLEGEFGVCDSLLKRISGFIERLNSETTTAFTEETLITEYQAILDSEKKLISDEETCREQKKQYLTSLLTDAGNWVYDALHDHSKRKKREADRLVKQALRASELQRLVQHFTHRVIEQEERIMRQKQRILLGEHKLEMLKSSDSWFLYVTMHTPDIGKHDAKCLETAKKEREDDIAQGGKLLSEDDADIVAVTAELEKSKACAEEKVVKREVWAYVEDVYSTDKPQEKDEDMMMTSQIRGLVAQLGETFEMLTNRLAEEEESLQHAYQILYGEVESIKSFMERIESEESALSATEKASLLKESNVRKSESDLVEQRARALSSNYKSIASEHAKLPVAFEAVKKTRSDREVPLKLRDAELEVARKLVKARNYYDKKACAEFSKKFVSTPVEMNEVRDILDWLLIAVDGDIKAVERWMELSKGERKEMTLLATKANEIDWSADMLTKIPAFIEVDEIIKDKGVSAVHAKEQWVVELINVKKAIASKDKDLCAVVDETLAAAKKEEAKVMLCLDKLKASKEEVINTLRIIDREEAKAVRNGKPYLDESKVAAPAAPVVQSNRKPRNSNKTDLVVDSPIAEEPTPKIPSPDAAAAASAAAATSAAAEEKKEEKKEEVVEATL
ncbi:hypothetical protein LEN26_017127 [Aphanomyces euteiches]|nr:hypothetical protein LEN26_017127 [Aphanomyces euteiches]KAH9128252.1 hypothetical protein AeMF1_001577 [Aphanomyces euteiches]KAH9186066.1 hypothetical protein AeNC1_011958 [Aphanomyces euteiches]